MSEIDDEAKQFLDTAYADIAPKMKQSIFCLICIDSREEPDPFLALQVGLALLYEKPLIIVAVGENVWVPERLRKLAEAVIVAPSALDPAARKALQDAIMELMDKRGLRQ